MKKSISFYYIFYLRGEELMSENKANIQYFHRENCRIIVNYDKIDEYDKSKSHSVMIYTRDFQYIGYCRVMRNDHRVNENYFTEFYIDEKFRHKGYGTSLLKFIIEEFNVKYCDVLVDNFVAIELYTKNGFKVAYTHKVGKNFLYRMRRK